MIVAELSIVQKIVAWSLPVIFAITLHEVAHGWVANKLGDPTAKFMGRLSWNPLHHIDLFGTIILPLVLLSVSNFVFGWAKPVPIDERNLRHKKRDILLVALAGPSSNFLMAAGWTLIAKLGVHLAMTANYLSDPLLAMGYAGIIINVMLGVLNLLPFPPLDGSKLLYTILPYRWSTQLQQFESSALWILAILSFSGILSIIIMPPVKILINFMESFIY